MEDQQQPTFHGRLNMAELRNAAQSTVPISKKQEPKPVKEQEQVEEEQEVQIDDPRMSIFELKAQRDKEQAELQLQEQNKRIEYSSISVKQSTLKKSEQATTQTVQKQEIKKDIEPEQDEAYESKTVTKRQFMKPSNSQGQIEEKKKENQIPDPQIPNPSSNINEKENKVSQDLNENDKSQSIPETIKIVQEPEPENELCFSECGGFNGNLSKSVIQDKSKPEEVQVTKYQLEIKSRKNTTPIIQIDQQTKKLGRAKANVDIQISPLNTQISGKHAIIKYRNDASNYYIQDTGSVNGTYINITNRTQIQIDDILGLGYYDVKIKQLTPSDGDINVDLQIKHGDDQEDEIDEQNNLKFRHINIKKDTNFNIGQSNLCNLELRDQDNLNQVQCKLTYDGKKLYVQHNPEQKGFQTFIKLQKEPSDKSERPFSQDKLIENQNNVVIRFAMEEFEVKFIEKK